METLSHDEAALKFVRAVVEKGNPEYFVWQFVNKLSSHELQEELEEFFEGEEFNVVDE